MAWIGKYIPIGASDPSQEAAPEPGLSLILLAYAAGAL